MSMGSDAVDASKVRTAQRGVEEARVALRAAEAEALSGRHGSDVAAVDVERRYVALAEERLRVAEHARDEGPGTREARRHWRRVLGIQPLPAGRSVRRDVSGLSAARDARGAQELSRMKETRRAERDGSP